MLGRIARRITLLTLVGIPLMTFAQDQFSFLDDVGARFEPLQHSWYAVISVYAQRLFWGLAAIDFGWTALILMLDQHEIPEFFGALVRKIITLGFFFGLLKMAGTWIPDIIDSFRTIGATAGAVPAGTTPDGVVSEGYELALGAFQALRELNVLEAIAVVLPVVMLAMLIFLAFLLIAAQLLATQMESYLCIGAGVILLGFGGARWTEDIASTYLRYALSVGLKLMIMYLVIGAGQTLFNALKLDPNHLIHSCLVVAGSALVYAYLTTQIPSIVRAMLLDSFGIWGEGVARAVLKTGAAVASSGGSAAVGGAKAIHGIYTLATSVERAVHANRRSDNVSELHRAHDLDTAFPTEKNLNGLDGLGLPHRIFGSKGHRAGHGGVMQKPSVDVPLPETSSKAPPAPRRNP